MTKPDADSVLSKYIEMISIDELTLEECVPELGGEDAGLGLAFLVASASARTSDFAPDTERLADAKARFLAAREQRVWERGIERTAPQPKRGALLLPRLRTRVAAMATAFAMFSGVSGSAVAMAGESVPGQPLYPVKRAVEKTKIVLTFDEETKSKLYLAAAKERMEELKVIGKNSPYRENLVDEIATGFELAKNTSAKTDTQGIKVALSELSSIDREAAQDVVAKAASSETPELMKLYQEITKVAVAIEDGNQGTTKGIQPDNTTIDGAKVASVAGGSNGKKKAAAAMTLAEDKQKGSSGKVSSAAAEKLVVALAKPEVKEIAKPVAKEKVKFKTPHKGLKKEFDEDPTQMTSGTDSSLPADGSIPVETSLPVFAPAPPSDAGSGVDTNEVDTGVSQPADSAPVDVNEPEEASTIQPPVGGTQDSSNSKDNGKDNNNGKDSNHDRKNDKDNGKDSNDGKYYDKDKGNGKDNGKDNGKGSNNSKGNSDGNGHH